MSDARSQPTIEQAVVDKLRRFGLPINLQCADMIETQADEIASLRSQVSELRAVLHWIEAHDRFWTSPEYEKGNEVLERADHNIKIRGAYGAAANVALKALSLNSQHQSTLGEK